MGDSTPLVVRGWKMTRICPLARRWFGNSYSASGTSKRDSAKDVILRGCLIRLVSLGPCLSLFVERVSILLCFLKLMAIAKMGIVNRNDLFLHAEVVLVSILLFLIYMTEMLMMIVCLGITCESRFFFAGLLSDLSGLTATSFLIQPSTGSVSMELRFSAT